MNEAVLVWLVLDYINMCIVSYRELPGRNVDRRNAERGERP